MSFDKIQFERLIINVIDRINMSSNTAVNLLLGTAAQESNFGTYLRQLGDGPARGVFQMEPDTEMDIWKNYLSYRPGLIKTIQTVVGVSNSTMTSILHLEGNLIYQIIMARLHYRRVKEPLPDVNDIKGLANYWKKYYNTALGKGTVEEFVKNYHKYVGE